MLLKQAVTGAAVKRGIGISTCASSYKMGVKKIPLLLQFAGSATAAVYVPPGNNLWMLCGYV